MTAKYTIEPSSKEALDGIVADLSRLRQWHAGFEAAGGKPPMYLDCLWRAQMLLGDAAKK